MELHAYTRTISDLFSVKRKYVVPRFQREYSWTKEQVRELWEDIVGGLERDGTVFKHEEYFIGALVLVGDDKSPVLQIVDGQQRLTTITILLSVISHRFKEIGLDNISKSIYENYIAGKDDDGKEYFKLENENPKPFFQRAIQHIEREKMIPSSAEERTLLSAYDDLYSYSSRDSMGRLFGISAVSNDIYEDFLKILRDQVVKYLKVIFITVNEEEEAYTIFETLNARGMNLSFVDLIKNKLFKELNSTHPDDRAKTTWKQIRSEISSRDGVGSLESYVRHWWISKHSYVSSDNVYKSFKKMWKLGSIDPKVFISELYEDAKIYTKISSPQSEDFPQQEERDIYLALSALKIFGIAQQKPFLLSLFRAKVRGVIKFSEVKEILVFLERFHFMFNAVCSLRPSGVEASYSRAARELELAKDRGAAKRAISALRESLGRRVPDESTFMEKFSTLKFYRGYTKDKKLIQYIFSTIERSRIFTNEFSPDSISIEHILSQSKGDKEVVGMIGNLLPLGQSLNGSADSKNVIDKLAIYQQSKFSMAANFVSEFSGVWSSNEIRQRTDDLARLCYSSVWAIN